MRAPGGPGAAAEGPGGAPELGGAESWPASTSGKRAREQFVAADAEERARGHSDDLADLSVPPDDLGAGPLAEQFIALAEALCRVAPEGGVLGVLEQVVHTAHQLVPDADVVSVTLRTGKGGFITPVETDPVATEADQRQYDAGEGPCIDATAMPGLGIAASPDLAHEPAWPTFGPAAAELGLHAVLSTGMFPRGPQPRFGALNYYAYSPHALDAVNRDIMLILAAHAATALHGVTATSAAELRATQLEEALKTRDVIGQAKGILMERRGLNAGEAFDVLRRASQNLNVKLNTVAAALADRRAEL